MILNIIKSYVTLFIDTVLLKEGGVLTVFKFIYHFDVTLDKRLVEIAIKINLTKSFLNIINSIKIFSIA